MDKAKHCEICENQLFDMKTGTKCSLTNERPDFIDTCRSIKLHSKYEQKIKEVNIEYQSILKNKNLIRINFLIYLSVSLVLLIGGFVLLGFIIGKGFIAILPFIIMGAGLLALPKAVSVINRYRHSMSFAKKKKEDLDELLSKYNVKYAIDVIFNTDIHGNDEIETKLTFLRKHYK